MAETRYFHLTADDVIARLEDGWRSQVWQPTSEQWADYPELDIAGEAREISAEDAEAAGADLHGHGEFAATEGQT